jgi:hypothetical protein
VAWCKASNIQLYISSDRETGALKEKKRQYGDLLQCTFTYRGKFETYYLTIKEMHKTINGHTSVSYLLIIDGSLHKNQYGGSNFLPFTWQDLQTQINYLENKLCLSAQECELVNLEFGVNIKVDFPVYDYMKRNLISYKGNQFNRYKEDKNGVCLGFVCDKPTQYKVKIYDKALQNDLPYNLVRFELRFLKMEKLKRLGIKHLADLTDQAKVQGLISKLVEGWDNVLLFDTSININQTSLRINDKELLTNGSNPKYWEQLKEENTRRFNHFRNRFRKLIETHGQNVHKTVRDLIVNEWQRLFKNCTKLPSGETKDLYKMTLKIKCQNVHKPFSEDDTELKPTKELSERTSNKFSYTKKRCCLSCGKDISEQQSSSRFCSSKFVGEREAKRCRNQNSNARNNRQRKINKINSKGVLFDVSPYIVERGLKKVLIKF